MSNALGQCWIQAVWLPSSSWMIPAGFSRWEVAGSTEVCCGFSRGAMLKVLQDGSIYWTNFRFVHCTGIVTVTFVAWGLGLRLLSHPLIQAKLLYHSCRALVSLLLGIRGCRWYWWLARSALFLCMLILFLSWTPLCDPLLEDRDRYPSAKGVRPCESSWRVSCCGAVLEG